MICFVTNIRPLSYNAKRKGPYQRKLVEEYEKKFKDLYPEVPLSGDLAIRIIYIHKDKKENFDVDNLSKPLVDAFRGILYDDDNLIIHRECTKIHVDDKDKININYAGISTDVAQQLNEYFENDESHIIYFEIDEFRYNDIKIGRKTP